MTPGQVLTRWVPATPGTGRKAVRFIAGAAVTATATTGSGTLSAKKGGPGGAQHHAGERSRRSPLSYRPKVMRPMIANSREAKRRKRMAAVATGAFGAR